MSRSKANLIRPRYARKQVAKLPEMLKPEAGGEGNEQQPSGLPGWLGTARVERLIEEPGRPCHVGGTQRPVRRHQGWEARQGVGGADSSWEAG